ncbi:hypothetical protein AB833_07290 [Chromatiales bacterium (ex Bugula neritina AB1)]|nr:hypothetical protein AB833_07290 [Chromatiales bacterium (ex Bugula neritina AB1)]
MHRLIRLNHAGQGCWPVLALFIVLLTSCSHRPSITTGDPDFIQFIVQNYHREKYRSFEHYLKIHKVHGVVPTSELFQQGTDWRRNGLPRYAFPPRQSWKHIIATLKVLQNLIIPGIGPVEVVSGFRTEAYNLSAGGAPKSQHLHFSAIDVVPRSNINQSTLNRQLNSLWQQHGRQFKLGLGLYPGKRYFHIDTGGFRRW